MDPYLLYNSKAKLLVLPCYCRVCKTFADEEAVQKLGDSTKVVLISGSPIYYESIPAIILSMLDISRQKNAERILKKYANTDELTGLLKSTLR